MVAKGKERAGLKLTSAAVAQEESRESTIAAQAPAQASSVEEVSEPSDEEPVGAGDIKALRKRVAEQEEYTRLLRRIKELEQEQNDLIPHTLRAKSEAIPLHSSKGPRFDKHTVEYRGRNLQELRQWIRALEDDHENFPDTFVNDQKRIFYASKALKYGS